MLGDVGKDYPVAEKDIIAERNKHYSRDRWEEDHEDIVAFDKALEACRKSFIKGKQHGNHLDKAKRFPLYFKCAEYVKCVRFITAFEDKKELADEEQEDLVNYPIMELSVKIHNDKEGQNNEKEI